MTGASGAIFWLVIAIALFIIEGATIQFICIWFAGGALAAMLASFMGAPMFVQLLVFFATSIAVLFVGRPILKERFTPEKTATNADAVIGKTGVVMQEIDNVLETGRVLANGLDWSARSADGSVICAEQTVIVKEIDGVKLIVDRIIEN